MASIDLQESLIHRLEALARSEGVTLEACLERVAQRGEKGRASRTPLSGDEFDKLLDAEVTLGHDISGELPPCGHLSRLRLKR